MKRAGLRIDQQRLERALDQLFDAAIDAAPWVACLEELVAATKSYAAMVVPFDRRIPHAAISTANIAPLREEYIRLGWMPGEWQAKARALLVRDGIVRTHQYAPDEAFERHEFYRFLAGNNIRYSCLIALYDAFSEVLCLGLHRHPDQGPFTDEEAAVLADMRHRFIEAARLAQRVSQNRLSGMIAGFDIAGTAAVFFDAYGKVTYVNAAAARVLGNELRVVDKELRSQNDAESFRIRRAIQEALAQGNSGAGDPSRLVSIERPGQQPITLRIQRIAGLFDLFASSVGVCVIEMAGGQASAASPDVLKRVFGLTEQETQIATRLCEGLSLREISERSGRSYGTVRTHVKSILHKTGTSRQGELIALMAKMRVPDGHAGRADNRGGRVRN